MPTMMVSSGPVTHIQCCSVPPFSSSSVVVWASCASNIRCALVTDVGVGTACLFEGPPEMQGPVHAMQVHLCTGDSENGGCTVNVMTSVSGTIWFTKIHLHTEGVSIVEVAPAKAIFRAAGVRLQSLFFVTKNDKRFVDVYRCFKSLEGSASMGDASVVVLCLSAMNQFFGVAADAEHGQPVPLDPVQSPSPLVTFHTLGISYAQDIIWLEKSNSKDEHNGRVLCISGTYAGTVVGWSPQPAPNRPQVLWTVQAHRPGCAILTLRAILSRPEKEDSATRIIVATGSDDRSVTVSRIPAAQDEQEPPPPPSLLLLPSLRLHGSDVASARMISVDLVPAALYSKHADHGALRDDDVMVLCGGEDGTVQVWQLCSPPLASQQQQRKRAREEEEEDGQLEVPSYDSTLLWRARELHPHHGCLAVRFAASWSHLPLSLTRCPLVVSAGYDGCVLVHRLPAAEGGVAASSAPGYVSYLVPQPPASLSPTVKKDDTTAKRKLRCLCVVPDSSDVVGVTDDGLFVMTPPPTCCPSPFLPLLVASLTLDDGTVLRPKASTILCRRTSPDVILAWIGDCSGNVLEVTCLRRWQRIIADNDIGSAEDIAMELRCTRIAIVPSKVCSIVLSPHHAASKERSHSLVVLDATSSSSALLVVATGSGGGVKKHMTIHSACNSFGVTQCVASALSDEVKEVMAPLVATKEAMAEAGSGRVFATVSKKHVIEVVCIWGGGQSVVSAPLECLKAHGFCEHVLFCEAPRATMTGHNVQVVTALVDVVSQAGYRCRVDVSFFFQQKSPDSVEDPSVTPRSTIQVCPLAHGFSWSASRVLSVSTAGVVFQSGSTVSIVNRCCRDDSMEVDINKNDVTEVDRGLHKLWTVEGVRAPRLISASITNECSTLAESPTGNEILTVTVWHKMRGDGRAPVGAYIQALQHSSKDYNACCAFSCDATGDGEPVIITAFGGETTSLDLVEWKSHLLSTAPPPEMPCPQVHHGLHISNILSLLSVVVPGERNPLMLSAGSLATMVLWRRTSTTLDGGCWTPITRLRLDDDATIPRPTPSGINHTGEDDNDASHTDAVPRLLCLASHPLHLDDGRLTILVGSSAGCIHVLSLTAPPLGKGSSSSSSTPLSVVSRLLMTDYAPRPILALDCVDACGAVSAMNLAAAAGDTHGRLWFIHLSDLLPTESRERQLCSFVHVAPMAINVVRWCPPTQQRSNVIDEHVRICACGSDGGDLFLVRVAIPPQYQDSNVSATVLSCFHLDCTPLRGVFWFDVPVMKNFTSDDRSNMELICVADGTVHRVSVQLSSAQSITFHNHRRQHVPVRAVSCAALMENRFGGTKDTQAMLIVAGQGVARLLL